MARTRSAQGTDQSSGRGSVTKGRVHTGKREHKAEMKSKENRPGRSPTLGLPLGPVHRHQGTPWKPAGHFGWSLGLKNLGCWELTKQKSSLAEETKAEASLMCLVNHPEQRSRCWQCRTLLRPGALLIKRDTTNQRAARDSQEQEITVSEWWTGVWQSRAEGGRGPWGIAHTQPGHGAVCIRNSGRQLFKRRQGWEAKADPPGLWLWGQNMGPPGFTSAAENLPEGHEQAQGKEAGRGHLTLRTQGQAGAPGWLKGTHFHTQGEWDYCWQRKFKTYLCLSVCL